MEKIQCLWDNQRCPIEIPGFCEENLNGSSEEKIFLKCLYKYIINADEDKYKDIISCTFETIYQNYSKLCILFNRLDSKKRKDFIKNAVIKNNNIFRLDMMENTEEIHMHINHDFVEKENNYKQQIFQLIKDYERISSIINFTDNLAVELTSFLDYLKRKKDDLYNKLEIWLKKGYFYILDTEITDIKQSITDMDNRIKEDKKEYPHLKENLGDLVKKVKRIIEDDHQRRGKVKAYVRVKSHPPPVKLRLPHYFGSNNSLRKRLGLYFPAHIYQKIFIETEEIIKDNRDYSNDESEGMTIIRSVNIIYNWIRIPLNIIKTISNFNKINIKSSSAQCTAEVDDEYNLVHGSGIGRFLEISGFAVPGLILTAIFSDKDHTLYLQCIKIPSVFKNIICWDSEHNIPVCISIPGISFQFKVDEKVYRSEKMYENIIPIYLGVLTAVYEMMEKHGHLYPDGVTITEKDIFEFINKKRPVSYSSIIWTLYSWDCFVKVDNNRWLLIKNIERIKIIESIVNNLKNMLEQANGILAKTKEIYGEQ